MSSRKEYWKEWYWRDGNRERLLARKRAKYKADHDISTIKKHVKFE